MSIPKQHKAQIELQSVYLKDCSFESPGSPQTLRQQFRQLESKVNIRLNSNPIEDQQDHYEVILTITVEARYAAEPSAANQPEAVADDAQQTVFICELHIAGLFKIQTDDAQALEYVTQVHCPKELFPYAREYLSNMIMRGGFKPLLLQFFNFEVLYLKKKQAQKQRQAATLKTPPASDLH